MSNTFCTIITQSHLPYAKALHHSLIQFDNSIVLHVLIVDFLKEDQSDKDMPTVERHALGEIAEFSPVGQKIIDKYNTPNTLDLLRWSLKPILINYLLEKGYEKVIFTDPDTYYFSDYRFLFTELDEHNVLLTPHWRGETPEKNETNFNLQFTEGLFNAGFIAVNRDSKEVLNWWAERCFENCEKNACKGHFVDQTYLNLIPIYFDKVKILKHKGCNVANWNQLECPRTTLKDGLIFIDKSWPIVFIHFTTSTIKGIEYGQDKLLTPKLEEYKKSLKRFGKYIITNSDNLHDKKMKNRSYFWLIKNWINKRITF